MALKFRRGTTAQKSGSLAFGEPYVNTTLGTLQVGGQSGDITLLINSASQGISGSSLDITGNAKIDGNLSLGGQLTIGDQTSDTVNLVASLSSSLIPSETNAFDLGSSTKIWRDLYISTGSIKMVNPANNTVVGTLSSNADGSQTFSGLIRANSGIFIPNSIQVTGTGGLGIGGYGDRLMLGTSGSAGAGQQSLIFTTEVSNAYTFPNGSGTIALTSDLTSTNSSVSNLNSFTSSINTTIKTKLDTDGVISGSSQVSYLGLSNIPAGIVSGSIQVLGGTGIVSSSAQIDALFNLDGVISGSSQVTLSSTTGGGTTSNVQFGSLGIGTAASGVSGEIRATADIVAYYSSDNRLKENIKPINDALDKVKKISGNTYDWKEGFEDIHSHTGEDVGVIAQEVEAVMPQLVTTREHGYKAVQYEKLTALLIEAIKEQQIKIDNLTIEVENLKKQKGL